MHIEARLHARKRQFALSQAAFSRGCSAIIARRVTCAAAKAYAEAGSAARVPLCDQLRGVVRHWQASLLIRQHRVLTTMPSLMDVAT
jgi:hypothetical protein